MEQDPDAIRNLDREFEETIARERAQAENELKEEISKAHANSAKTLDQEDIKNIEQNFWNTKQPELDNRSAEYEKLMFENFGGSREEALKHLESGQDQIQKAKELQENQQLDAQNERQKADEITRQQNQDLANEQKKEKEKKEQVEKEKQDTSNKQQQSKEKMEQQSIEEERNRIREQFNQMSQARSLDQGKDQSL